MCRLWGVTYLAWLVFAVAEDIWPLLEELSCHLCLVAGLCKSGVGTWALPASRGAPFKLGWQTAFFKLLQSFCHLHLSHQYPAKIMKHKPFVKGWNRVCYQQLIHRSRVRPIFLVKDLYVEMLINIEIMLINEYIWSSHSTYMIW